MLRKELPLANIEIGFDRHKFRCPHCEKQTLLEWPGSTVLFANAICQHCGREFVIVDNEPRK